MKQIVVTTDLSDESTKAYPYAVKLANALGARVSLVTFIDSSIQIGMAGPFDLPISYTPEPFEQIQARVQADLEKHRATYFSGLVASCEVRESKGPVHYGIVDYIAQTDVDMAVMASHGRSGIARTLMGSVTEQVLRRSTKPVLVVPVGT